MIVAGEDDLVHARAAQLFGALLTEHPAHRVDEIGFARAVRTDDRSDAWFEDETGSLRERLEAEKVDAF
jgi:hypothetical protein